ncbi:MAG: glycosyltransferase [Bacteroidota bacterium]
MLSLYLERYAWKQELFPDFNPPHDLGTIIVLPAFKEPEIELALEALNQCLKPEKEVLILIIVNESKDASREVTKINQECLQIIRSFDAKFNILTSYLKLPEKKAGVGLARKIGMDEAVRMFRKADHDGIIICYDADSRCDENYLKEIEKTYQDHNVHAGIVFHEHQLNRENHDAILQYELYLRYYIDALRFSGFPHAYQTLGSCITIRCSQYEKVGGMNTRKAGEDFYFLNKIIPPGGFVEINSTTVRPSDRISDRVPFGTGKAVNDILHSEETYNVYHPNSFEDLKIFFDRMTWFTESDEWIIPKTVQAFLGMDWKEQILELKSNVASQESFEKRFFQWFDAFKVLKFVHFCRDNFYQNVELEEALNWLRQHTLHLSGSLVSQLIQLRYFDRNYKNRS